MVVSAVCTCPTSLPVQEEICNIGNSPNSTTKCLTLSFIYVFFFFPLISLFFSFFLCRVHYPQLYNSVLPSEVIILITIALMGVREL